MCVWARVRVINCIPWQRDSSCASLVQRAKQDHTSRFPVMNTLSFSEENEAQGPHRRCGGKEIACHHIGKLKELVGLGAATTLCNLVLCFGSPSATVLVDCLGKSMSPTGLSRSLSGYQLRPVRIGSGAPLLKT